MSEHAEQVALFRWADLQSKRYPALRLLFAVPNGGKRDKVTAGRLKAEGVKAGVPDLFLPYPVRGSHGLAIELKRPKSECKAAGRLTEAQQRWIIELSAVGYSVGIAYGWDEARRLIEEYLAI